MLLIRILVLLFISSALPAYSEAQALDKYLAKTDSEYSWKKILDSPLQNGRLIKINLVSQKWREIVWKHELAVFIPNECTNKKVALLKISGRAKVDDELPFIAKLANATSSPVVILGSVPNQPLFDGKSEDELLAYTFKQFIDSGDPSWPIIFPMVKSVIRAMDAVTEVGRQEKIPIESFVVTGSSKRGWTTYLTGASDSRVIGIAPMVFDMLNIRQQLSWAEQMYGKQSEKIKNYTELGLVERIDEPRTKELRTWIDPFEYRDKLTQSKLILLGTNDPYWVVDSQQHYVPELPGKKLLYQVPNGTHHISEDMVLLETLTAWFRLVAAREVLPVVNWKVVDSNGKSKVQVSSTYPISKSVLWQAQSKVRDFRNAKWTSSSLNHREHSVELEILPPVQGFKSWLVELTIGNGSSRFAVSTEAWVRPEKIGTLTDFER